MLANKAPIWSYENQSYVLNFHGRVTRVSCFIVNFTFKKTLFQASVKNFQLVSACEASHVVMQFGRVGTDTFTMDFRSDMQCCYHYQVLI